MIEIAPGETVTVTLDAEHGRELFELIPACKSYITGYLDRRMISGGLRLLPGAHGSFSGSVIRWGDEVTLRRTTDRPDTRVHVIGITHHIER